MRRFLAIALLLAAILLQSSTPAQQTADSLVIVSEIFAGQREIVGITRNEHHALLFSAEGSLLSWTDPAGDVVLPPSNNDAPLIELIDPRDPHKRLLPAPKAVIEVQEKAKDQAIAAVRQNSGVQVEYIVEPARWGVRVQGPAKEYLVRGRIPCRAESCRLVTPQGVSFVSAGIGAHTGGPQTIIDGRRALGIALSPPEKSTIVWRHQPLDGWGAQLEHVIWDWRTPPGEVLWIASAPAPAHTGPVKVGLARRRLFRPESTPALVAELSRTRLTAGETVDVMLPEPLEKVVPDGVLVAALVPITQTDPIETCEEGRWYERFDHYEDKLLPAEVQRSGAGWKIVPPAVASGVYRLRLWVVPRETPRPEALGGAKGVRIGYFPGFENRSNQIRQNSPTGDVLLVIAPPARGSVAVLHPTARTSFWRGEPVHLLVQARAATGQNMSLESRVTLRPDGSKQPHLASMNLSIPLTSGFGVTEFALSTANLPPGRYIATAESGDLAVYAYTFTVAPPRPSAMPVIHSPLTGPGQVELFDRLGVNAWVDIMPPTSGLIPAWPAASGTGRGLRHVEPALSLAGSISPGAHDELMRRNFFFLQGIQSRQISFAFHHSIPEHVEETKRKHLLYAQFGRRFPSTLGLIFDYDLSGTFGGAEAPGRPYTIAGERRTKLLAQGWEKAWQVARASGASEADRSRLQSLFHAAVIEDLYRDSIRDLHAAIPEQRHSTSTTPDHNEIPKGQYLPSIYRPLDFRYLEVWNDQVYPNAAHDMMESFWTSLLAMEKPRDQPIWITVPTSLQPGTHFRRTLEASARGANSTGYNAEGAAGLTGGWGIAPATFNARAAQEELTPKMALRYGAWLNAFESAEDVAILYSVSQGLSNFGLQSPTFFAYFTLAQLNRPAKLLTEDEIAAGALKSVKALVIVRQTAKLPQATLKAIDAFQAAGGIVICDKHSDPKLPGTHLAAVEWPTSLWPNSANTYHHLIQSYTTKAAAALLETLKDAGRQPLESVDSTTLIASKKAEGATLVFVTNNQEYPFEELFTPDQRLAQFWRLFMNRGSTYYKDTRVPHVATVKLREDLAREKLHIYDVFAGAEVTVQRQNGQAAFPVDLVKLPARVFLITRSPLDAPTLSVAARADGDPLATLVVQSPVPLPIRVRVGQQEIHRAATPKGSCDTFALRLTPGQAPVEVMDLITGKVLRTSLHLSQAPRSELREAPAVQIADRERLLSVLTAKGLAIYVDPRQAFLLPAARRLAGTLGAEVVFNPAIRDYPVNWDHPSTVEESNEQIRQTGVLGWRRQLDYHLQWTGAMRPAPAWNRPVLLFGNARDNRVLAELDRVALLARPASPELIGPGRALVQPVAAPFWNGKDAAVILCADAAGLDKAIQAVEALVRRSATVETFSLTDDGGARRDLRAAIGLESPRYPTKLQPLAAERSDGAKTRLDPVLPVADVRSINGGVLAILHSPGRNFVRLDDKGRTIWRTISGAFYQPTRILADDMGESVVADDTLVWRHAPDGKLRWKMLGELLAIPRNGAVWVSEESGNALVDDRGSIVERSKRSAQPLAMSSDARTLIFHQPGDAKTGRRKSGSSLVAVRDGKEAWKVDNLFSAEARVSADGTAVACLEHECLAGRDDIEHYDASRLTVIDAASGKVLMRRPLGETLANLCVSRDGKTLLALGHAGRVDPFPDNFRWNLAGNHMPNRYTDVVYIADVASGTARRVKLPERGIWANDLSLDGKTCWLAADRLYRIDVATLTVTPCANLRLLCLSPRSDGGLHGGTADGKVVWIDASGKVEREVDIAADLGTSDIGALLRPLRDVAMPGSEAARPIDVPGTIPLARQAHFGFMVRGDLVSPRGDGIQPISVAFQFPHKGRYRFTLTLENARADLEKVGLFRLNSPHSRGPLTAPVDGNRLRQTVEFDHDAGAELITIMPEGWKMDPLLRNLIVERQ